MGLYAIVTGFMAVDLSNTLVAGVSSRSLFDLSKESMIFERDGLRAYKEYQLANKDVVLEPGPAFPLVKALLNLNKRYEKGDLAEVVIMSRNSTETSDRIFNSIKHHQLNITRAVLTGGAPLAPYLAAFCVNLFLSMDEADVETALESGFPAAILYDLPENPLEELEEIRIAFDGDAVLFSEESEQIFQKEGIDAFHKHELANADIPMNEGPFAKFLKALSIIQEKFQEDEKSPIRTALVTTRSSPAHERAIKTLRSWRVQVNEAFFLGGVPKGEILRAFKPQMFFDDHFGHCEDAVRFVPTGRVPADVRKKRTGNE